MEVSRWYYTAVPCYVICLIFYPLYNLLVLGDLSKTPFLVRVTHFRAHITIMGLLCGTALNQQFYITMLLSWVFP